MNLFDHSSVRATMIGNLPDRLYFAEFQDIPGQSSGHLHPVFLKTMVLHDAPPAGLASCLVPRIEDINISNHSLAFVMHIFLPSHSQFFKGESEIKRGS